MPHKFYDFIASIRQKISGTDSSSHYENFGAVHHYPKASFSNPNDNRLFGSKKNDQGYGSLSERKCKGRYDDQSSLLSDNEDSSYNAVKYPATKSPATKSTATKSSRTIKEGIKSFASRCTIS